MANEIDLGFDLKTTAQKIVIKKLKDQGVDYKMIHDEEFDELVKNREAILEKDVKQIGVTAAITLALTLLTGGI